MINAASYCERSQTQIRHLKPRLERGCGDNKTYWNHDTPRLVDVLTLFFGALNIFYRPVRECVSKAYEVYKSEVAVVDVTVEKSESMVCGRKGETAPTASAGAEKSKRLLEQ